MTDPDDDPFAPSPGATDPVELELGDKPVVPRAAPRALGNQPYQRGPAPVEPAAPTPAGHASSIGAILLLPIVVLLPARWRAHVALASGPLARAASLLEGFTQMVGALMLFGWLIIRVNERQVAPGGGDLVKYLDRGGSEQRAMALPGTGLATFLYVLWSPLGLFIVYLMVEGIVRLVATGIAGELLASGPLALADGLFVRARDHLRDRKLGPLVPDEVTRSAGGQMLSIASCRPRGWHSQTVLEIDGELWRLTGSSTHDGGARRWVYRFELAPAGTIVRGRASYRRDQLLAERDAARATFWRQVGDELRKMFSWRRP